MQDPEAFESARQTRRYDIVYAKLDASGIATPAPMEAQKPECGPDHCMDRIPVLQMEEVQALAKDLGFVVFFDTKTLPGMNAAQALVQPLADVDHCGSPSSSAEKRRVHLCSHALQAICRAAGMRRQFGESKSRASSPAACTRFVGETARLAGSRQTAAVQMFAPWRTDPPTNRGSSTSRNPRAN